MDTAILSVSAEFIGSLIGGVVDICRLLDHTA